MRRNEFLAALLVAGGALWACDGEDAGPTACTDDFDCLVGEICEKGDEGGTCAPAGAGAQRNFGQVTMEVGSDTEVWLLSVHSVPTDDEVPNDVASFYLNPAAGQTLRVARQEPRLPTWNVDRWRSRIGFESARRHRLDRLIEDLRAGDRRVRDAEVRQPATCASDCGTDMCWEDSSNPGTKTCQSTGIQVAFADGNAITCDLAGVVDVPGGGKINVLLDQASSGASTAAMNAAGDFASTFADQLDFLGQSSHGGDADRDGDGRMTVVFTNYESTSPAIGADIVGFFWYPDFLPASDGEATGNEADILWARVPDGTTITEAISTGTLAHEYTHLASYAVRVQAKGNDALREVLWLDEGISHLMEDLTGWGASNVDTVAAALLGWTDAGFATSSDSLEQRGRSYLLLRHMVDQAGSGDANSTATRGAARTLVSSLIAGEKLGWGHDEFQNLPKDAIWRMTLAAYATGRTDLVSGANAYDFLQTATSGGRTYGMNTHGSYDDGRSGTVDLGGPDISTTLDIAPNDFDDVVTQSGGVLYELSGMSAGTVTITGRVDASIDLRLHVQKVLQ